MATSKKTFSRIGLALVAAYAAIIVFSRFVFAPLLTQTDIARLAETIGPSLTLSLTYIPNIIFLAVFWLIIRKIPRSEWQGEAMSFRCLFQIFVMMYVISIVINILGMTVSEAAPARGNESLEMIGSIVSTGLPIGFLMVTFIAPVVEELIFRKLMLDRIRNCGEKTAIVFSALCFGLFHGNLAQFLYAFSVGLFLGYVYCRTRKVHYTIVMHTLLNTISSTIMLFAPAMKDDGKAVLIVIPLVLVIATLFVCGIVQLIRHLKRRDLHLDNTMVTCIPKEEVLQTVYLNPCVMLFILYCVTGIVMDLMNIHVMG